VKNYKLIIQYDGTDYSGWQFQENAVSVQQKIEDAIQTVTREKVSVIGSGRTDSGVHALGQTANFRIDQQLDLYRFNFQLNSILPKDIAIVYSEEVPFDFHARFDARKRSYIYLFSKKKSPFYFRYSGFYSGVIDCNLLNELGKTLLGEHDFSSFAKKSVELENKNCTIHNIHWRKSGELTVFYIEANRFLHGMVRTIAGTLLNAAETGKGKDYLNKVLEHKNRASAGESVPAKGLFLYKIKY
jgi:tRNA pseudouridine38-40 synthase